MSVVDVQAFVKVLLGDHAVWNGKDLTGITIIAQAFPNSVRESSTSVNVTEQNIRLLIEFQTG